MHDGNTWKYHGTFKLLQTVHESPVKNVEDYKHEWEQYAGTFVDPRGDLLRRHGGPVVFGRFIRALAAGAALLFASLPDELVEALRRDRRQVHCRWEAVYGQVVVVSRTRWVGTGLLVERGTRPRLAQLR